MGIRSPIRAVLRSPLRGPVKGVVTPLTPIAAFASTTNDEVFENLDIDATSGPVEITHRVVMNNCRIRHKGGRGLVITGAGASESEFRNLDIAHIDQPDGIDGHATTTEENVYAYQADDLIFDRVRTYGGSTGIYLLKCDRPSVTNCHAERMQGPFPRGMGYQFNQCDSPVLDGFSVVNDVTNSFPEDHVSVILCTGSPVVRNGLVDGNNSTTGDGIMIETTSSALVEDVDAVNQANGCFSQVTKDVGTWLGSTFRRCRAKDGHLTDYGRGTPTSNGITWKGYAAVGSGGTLTGVVFDDCQHYNVANPSNIYYDRAASFAGGGSFTVPEADFTARSPIALTWGWQDWRRGPFIVALNRVQEITNAASVGDTVATGFAESADPDETFTFAVDDARFEFDGDTLKVSSSLAAVSGSIDLEITATGSRGQSLTKTIAISVYEAEAVSLFARFTTDPTDARKVLMNALIGSLKAAGVWAKLDALYLTAAADAQAAQRNWIADAYNLTPTNSPSFTPDGYYAPNGSSSYLDTGFNPSTAVSPKFVLNSGMIAVWGVSNNVAGGLVAGWNDGTNGARVGLRNGSDQATLQINQSGTHTASGITDSRGLTLAQRTNTDGWRLDKDGSQIGTNTTGTITAVPVGTFKIGRTAASSYSSQRIGAAAFGSAISAAESAALYDALNDYLTAIGAV